jgi:nucleoside-diphosphate-sugar epimerase
MSAQIFNRITSITHAHYQNFTQADLTNARTAFGYEPRFPLEDGVRDYMQWLYPR